MSLKIYADLLSQPSRALVIFCRAAKVPHEFKPVKLTKREHLSKEMTKINPFQKVPFATHNGIALKESMAILKYISQAYPVEEHWYPKEDFLAQQRLEEYLHWQHLNTRMNCAMFFRTKWLVPLMKFQLPDGKKVATLQKRMETTLDEIEQIWLENGQKKFICGDKISVADIVACCELEQPSIAGYDVTANRPVLKDYMTRVKAELEPHYNEVHKTVYSMTKKWYFINKLLDFFTKKN